MGRQRVQRIQDSIHGLMEFQGMETVIIDLLRTPELQRLRRIKQLGLVHQVFPAAEHSRFTHSLGTSYLAIKFGRQLRDITRQKIIPSLAVDETVIRDLAVAALCHDLGHGPLSHAWEREIVGYDFKREIWIKKLGLPEDEPVYKRMKWHELVGHAFLLWEDGTLHRLLEQHEIGSSDRIRNFLTGKYFISFLPRLLSSDIDVDRADFIKRDTHQTGVAYGRYDLDWLISTCTIGTLDHPNGKEWVLGFDQRKAIRVIEQFLIARRALYETVYHHKTVRSAEGLVALFLRRLKEVIKSGKEIFKGVELFNPIYKTISGEALEPHELLSIDDYTLSHILDLIVTQGADDRTLVDLANRIVTRDLFKIVPIQSRTIRTFMRNPNAKKKLHDVIDPYCPGDSKYYIIFDEFDFKMLSSDEKDSVYLVDTDSKAKPIYLDKDLRSYAEKNIEGIRLFTLREAIKPVVNLIEGN